MPPKPFPGGGPKGGNSGSTKGSGGTKKPRPS